MIQNLFFVCEDSKVDSSQFNLFDNLIVCVNIDVDFHFIFTLLLCQREQVTVLQNKIELFSRYIYRVNDTIY